MLLLVFMLVAIRGARYIRFIAILLLRSYGCVVVAYVFGSFFGNNFAFENLQPLANPKSGWFTSIIMIVAW